jgi:type IV secretory pathway VirB4 component
LLWMPPADDAARAEGWLYEGKDEGTTRDGREVLAALTDMTGRVLALVEAFMPEARWLSDEETLTYLHSTVSTRPSVRVPETPAYLDAILVDQPLTGGLEPKLGDAHLRTLTLSGFHQPPRFQGFWTISIGSPFPIAGPPAPSAWTRPMHRGF